MAGFAPLAFAVAPNLASLTPAGGQRGTTLEVTLQGERLADAQEILFYDPGIAVEKIIEAADKKVRVTLRIAPDCALGEHALRLRTGTGLSALRIIYVGPFPTIEEKKGNHTRATAQPVPLNSTVAGTLAGDDVDYYSVEVKKGERLSVEIEGARLGRTMFDPHLAIQDESGRVLAATNHSALLGHDGFLTWLTPADGKYFVAVHDIAYVGNGHVYRLHLGNFPRPAVAFPIGGRPGETVAEKFLGDAAGDFTAEVKLPDRPETKFGVVAERDGVAPSPNWMRVADLPNVSDLAAGPTLAQAVRLDVGVPFAFNGVLAHAGADACFRFAAKKDQQLELQVFGRRFGSPIDSVLTVYNAKGGTVGSNDDAEGNPDSLVRVRIPEDGDYTVKVADQLHRGGAQYVYRVEVTEVTPTLTLSIPDTARYDNETRKSIVVPRGNRFAVLMNVTRDGFGGDLSLGFDGLPAGMSFQAEPLPGSVSAEPVVFEAEADAPLAGDLLAPVGRPVEADPAKRVISRFRHRVEWVRIENDTAYVKSEVDRIAAAVVEAVPFKIRVVEPKAPLVQNGDLALQVVAERAPGFDEPIALKMLWNPPEVSSPPEVVIPKGATTASYKLNANGKAQARAWKTAVIASAPVDKGTAYVSSQLARIEIAPAFLAGKMELAKVERGQTGTMTCQLEQKIPFEGSAVIRLVGLPAGVTAKDVEITKESKVAKFELTATEKATPGMTKNVFCNVSIQQNGETISQNIALGSAVRIDAPRAAPKPASVATAP